MSFNVEEINVEDQQMTAAQEGEIEPSLTLLDTLHRKWLQLLESMKLWA